MARRYLSCRTFVGSLVLLASCSSEPAKKSGGAPANVGYCNQTPAPAQQAPIAPSIASGVGTGSAAATQAAPYLMANVGSGQPGAMYLQAAVSKDYINDAKPILDANCLGGCHNAGGTAAASAVLDSFAGVKAVSPTKLKASYQSAAANRMPKGGAELGAISKSILDDFITAGVVEDKKVAADPDNGKTTYNGKISAMLKANCIKCHDGKNAKLPNLTTYEGAKKEGANLALSLQDITIHKDTTFDKDASVALLELWENDGYAQGAATGPSTDGTNPGTANTLPPNSVPVSPYVPPAPSNCITQP